MPFTEEHEQELTKIEEDAKWRAAFADRVDEAYEKLRNVGLEAGVHKMSGIAGEMLTFAHRLGAIATENRSHAQHNQEVLKAHRARMEAEDLKAAQQVTA